MTRNGSSTTTVQRADPAGHALSRCSRWLALALAVVACEPASGQMFTPIRINAGGSAYTDSVGNVWSADTGFNTGAPWTESVAIAGTVDDSLYQTYRYDTSAAAPDLEYQFVVPNGDYQVNLLFAETWSPFHYVGARRFDVQIEGANTFPNLDIYAEVGANTALVKSASIAVADEMLHIRFARSINNPVIYAIEVTASSSPRAPTNVVVTSYSTTQLNVTWSPAMADNDIAMYEIERCQGATCSDFTLLATSSEPNYQDSGLLLATTYRYRLRAIDVNGSRSAYSLVRAGTTHGTTSPNAIRVNAGGSAYTDSASNLWSADFGYNAGSPWTQNVAIGGTTDDALYQTYRWHTSSSPELEYAFTVPPGRYQIRLHFAETWSPYFFVGARSFHVHVEGALVLPGVDVFAEAGGNAALTKVVTAIVSDGQINIRLVRHVQNPVISAIEVVWSPAPDGIAPSTPANVSALPTSGGGISLSWSASTDNTGVVGYSVERCRSVACRDFAEIASLSGLALVDTAVDPAALYRYRLRAYDASGNLSAYTSPVDVITEGGGVGITQYLYDSLGRLALAVLPDGSAVVYTHDENGNVTTIIRTAPP